MTDSDLTAYSPFTGGYIGLVSHWLDGDTEYTAYETTPTRYGRRAMRLGIPASPIVQQRRRDEMMVTTHQDGRATLWRLGWATPADLLPGSTYESDAGSVHHAGRPWVVEAVYASADAASHVMGQRAHRKDN